MVADGRTHFSVHEPGEQSSKFLYESVVAGNEKLTRDQILDAEKRVQVFVHTTMSQTAIVKYLALATSARTMPKAR
jgi:hypothetical protein